MRRSARTPWLLSKRARMDSENWIWGRRPVLEALRGRSVRKILVASGRTSSTVLDEIQSLSVERGVQLREVPPAELESISGSTRAQGVAALVIPVRQHSLADLLASPTQCGNHFLLCLDQIQDPQNLGALLRTANAAGIGGVVLPDRRSAPLTGTVVKASAGATLYTPIVRVPNLARALAEVRRAGIWLVGLAGEANESIFEIDLTMPLALVIGGERAGMRRLTREQCDLLARIPMHGAIESLNAAVAGSIAMYEVVRQRQLRIGGPA